MSFLGGSGWNADRLVFLAADVKCLRSFYSTFSLVVEMFFPSGWPVFFSGINKLDGDGVCILIYALLYDFLLGVNYINVVYCYLSDHYVLQIFCCTYLGLNEYYAYICVYFWLTCKEWVVGFNLYFYSNNCDVMNIFHVWNFIYYPWMINGSARHGLED